MHDLGRPKHSKHALHQCICNSLCLLVWYGIRVWPFCKILHGGQNVLVPFVCAKERAHYFYHLTPHRGCHRQLLKLGARLMWGTFVRCTEVTMVAEVLNIFPELTLLETLLESTKGF